MPNEIEAFTWLGAVMLALCGIPQAWDAYRHPKSTRSLSWAFLILWGLGELSLFTGLAGVVSVLANYAGNFLLVCYIIGVKYVNRRHL